MAQHYTIYNGDEKYEFDAEPPKDCSKIFERREGGTVHHCERHHSPEIINVMIRFLEAATDYCRAQAILRENHRRVQELDYLACDLKCWPLKRGLQFLLGERVRHCWDESEYYGNGWMADMW